MLSRALKEHNSKQAELKSVQERRRREAVAAADALAKELVDSLNSGYVIFCFALRIIGGPCSNKKLQSGEGLPESEETRYRVKMPSNACNSICSSGPTVAGNGGRIQSGFKGTG
jgi:hypothetical protein